MTWQFHIGDYPEYTKGIVTVSKRNNIVDDSFETALAVALGSRLEKLGGVQIIYDKMDVFAGVSFVDFHDVNVQKRTIVLCAIRDMTSSPNFGKLKTVFPKEMEGKGCAFKYIGSPSTFIQQKSGTDCACFYDANNETSVVFYGGAHEDDAIHITVSMISIIAPWIFSNGKPTDEEMKFLKAMSDNDLALCVHLYDEFKENDRNRGIKLRHQLKGFTSSTYEARMNAILNEIGKLNAAIERELEEIRRKSEMIEKMNVEYTTLSQMCEDDENIDNQLFEFVKKNRQISVMERSQESIRFCVQTTLDLVDEQMYKNYILKNSRSSILVNSHFSTERMKNFYRAVWETHKFKIRVWAVYDMTTSAQLVPMVGERYKPPFVEDRLPQPHIVIAGCVGGYHTYMAEMNRSKNFIGAIMTSISITKSLNLSDSIIVSYFRESVNKAGSIKFVETRDGRCITLEEAMVIIDREGIE